MADFTHIKEGDEVVRLFSHGSAAVVYTVTNVTPKHFDAVPKHLGGSEVRCRKVDGIVTPYGRGAYLQPMSETLQEKINETYRVHLESRLGDRLRGLSLEKLEKIKAIVEGQDG